MEKDKSYVKSDCINYDYGDTCPTVYGAFCKPHNGKKVKVMTLELCKNCKDYTKKIIKGRS